MSLIELQNVSVRLGSQNVLNELSLKLNPCERLVLMGPSGAGKSTLLRVMAGLQQPSTGNVLLNGQPMGGLTAKERGIAWLSQDYALYPQLNVEQNIAVALQQQGMTSAQIIERFDQVAKWFSIEAIKQRLPSQISGGQAQRVAFAKALARHPQLLLLDEPFSQLDCDLRNQLTEVLLPACEQLKVAVCWVTHDPQEAFCIGTRIAVLMDGQLVQVSSPEEIYLAPATRQVADLTSIWPVNWLPLDRAEFASLLSFSPSARVAGVRPEHLLLAGAEAGFSFELTVERLQFLGFARIVLGSIGKTSVQMLDLEHRCRVGDKVKVSLDSSKILWLPRQFDEEIAGPTCQPMQLTKVSQR